jgi:hypothetical protein
MPGPTLGEIVDRFIEERLSLPESKKAFIDKDTILHFHGKHCLTSEGQCPYFEAGFKYARKHPDALLRRLEGST